MSDESPDDAELAKAVRTLAAELPDADIPSMIGTYAYFRAKAGIYLREGPEKYRREDFFHVPRAEWTAAELAALERGFREVCAWRGLTAAAPLEAADLADIYRLAEVTHFRLVDVATQPAAPGAPLVVLNLRHRMDGRMLRLVYRCRATEPTAGSFVERLKKRWLGGTSASTADADLRSETFGYNADNPILCWEPYGEICYLRELRCPNGHPFSSRRLGSMSGTCPDQASHLDTIPSGPGEPHSCIVDKYELECHEGEHTCSLYFDMYHQNAASQPTPRGLQRAPANA